MNLYLRPKMFLVYPQMIGSEKLDLFGLGSDTETETENWPKL